MRKKTADEPLAPDDYSIIDDDELHDLHADYDLHAEPPALDLGADQTINEGEATEEHEDDKFEEEAERQGAPDADIDDFTDVGPVDPGATIDEPAEFDGDPGATIDEPVEFDGVHYDGAPDYELNEQGAPEGAEDNAPDGAEAD